MDNVRFFWRGRIKKADHLGVIGSKKLVRFKYHLTIRAWLAPRHLLFLLKGPKDPSVHPVTYYFYSRARRTLPCTPSLTILTQGPEGSFRAPRHLLF